MKKSKKKSKKKYYRQPRDQHWTEEPQGRSIAFAEKYQPGDDASRQYADRRTQNNNDTIKKERTKKRRRKALMALGCVVLICFGYIVADVSIIRHETALEHAEEFREQEGDLTALTVEAKALYRESISLDGAVMLSSVIEEAIGSGYSAVTFDAKRADGTIGYQSDLALADTFSAVSSPASALKQSVEKLRENDIMPIARISCYRDNLAPLYAPQMAVTTENSTYMDADGNTYLNPDSEMTFHYIRDIIKECSSCGVTVFLLADCDLPAEVAGDYADGFAALSEKLSAEFGTSVKLLSEVPVTVERTETQTENDDEQRRNNEDDEENDGNRRESTTQENNAVKTAVEAFPTAEENQMYMIDTNVPAEELTPYLEAAGITSYVIREG